MTNVRLKAFPQMLAYDQMAGGRQTPFAMLSGPISYRSTCINTDEYGFRKTIYQQQKLSVTDLENLDSVSFLIGGSTAFGVGCSDDSTTIASMLSQKTNKVWINLGIRAGVSFQELIHLLQIFGKAKRIENIIFFSGINDIYTNFLHTEKSLYDHTVNQLDLEFVSKSLKRQIICKIFAKIHSCRTSDLQELPLKKIILGQFQRTAPAEHIPVEKICEIIKRNFLLYRGLKSLVNGQVGFVLQPYYPWTNKKPSAEEDVTMAYLDKLQADTAWPEIRAAISEKAVYNTITECYLETSKKENIPFADSNPLFNTSASLFVDSVHLTDEGNKIATDLILQKFNILEK